MSKIRTLLADKTNSFHTNLCRFNLSEKASENHRIGDLGPGCRMLYGLPSFPFTCYNEISTRSIYVTILAQTMKIR
jgi:hypothetical protein